MNCDCFSFTRTCDKTTVPQVTGCPDVTWFWALSAAVVAFALLTPKGSK